MGHQQSNMMPFLMAVVWGIALGVIFFT